jgi:leucyl-tRNA synthetase
MLKFFRIISKFNRQKTPHIPFIYTRMESKTDEKPTVRRDRLVAIEHEAQKIWADHKFHERDPIPNAKKFMVTFPYPYMNGRLHLGHAYSMTKAEFTVRYKRIKGYNAIWPFSFHCTGMPIAAAAFKLKREFDTHGDKLPEFATAQETEFKEQVKKAQKDKKFQVTVKLP